MGGSPGPGDRVAFLRGGEREVCETGPARVSGPWVMGHLCESDGGAFGPVSHQQEFQINPLISETVLSVTENR